MIKAAFFDIDGTLLSFKTHKLAASTKAALIELRSRGVKCFIASGRPEYQLPPCIRHGFEGFDGFDAYVTFTRVVLLRRRGHLLRGAHSRRRCADGRGAGEGGPL